jgi:hypothetical protein
VPSQPFHDLRVFVGGVVVAPLRSGLAKTCDKLGIAVLDYLGSRLKVAGLALVEPLDHYVRAKIRPA